jgi:predicted O-methyltransferase YrrM
MTSELAREYRDRAAREGDIREQLPVLYAWARHATKVIELGVRFGDSTSAFLAALEGRGELWSVDIHEPRVPAYWLALPAWHLLVTDDLAEEAVSFCPDLADVLFIDTSHYYLETVAELDRYVPKVRPGGVVLMHDTCQEWPDVSRALDDWCKVSGMSWYDHPGWPGLGIIEVPGA